MSEFYSWGSNRSSVTKSQRKKRKKQAHKSYKKWDAIRKMINDLSDIDSKEADAQLEKDLITLSS